MELLGLQRAPGPPLPCLSPQEVWLLLREALMGALPLPGALAQGLRGVMETGWSCCGDDGAHGAGSESPRGWAEGAVVGTWPLSEASEGGGSGRL